MKKQTWEWKEERKEGRKEGTSTWTRLVASQVQTEEWVNTIQQYTLKVEL